MKMKLILALLCAAAAVLGTGCHEGGAYAPVNATKYDLENKSMFVLMDQGAQNSVTCSGIQTSPLPDGRLRVRANIRNRDERRIEVQVNCVFKDEQGFPTGDETPFQTLILTENGQEGVQFDSMNALAKRFTIRVRQSR